MLDPTVSSSRGYCYENESKFNASRNGLVFPTENFSFHFTDGSYLGWGNLGLNIIIWKFQWILPKSPFSLQYRVVQGVVAVILDSLVHAFKYFFHLRTTCSPCTEV